MESSQTISLSQARAAKPLAAAAFESLASDVSVGITRIGDGYGLKVNLTSEPVDGTQFPLEIDGVPVKVEFAGRPRKQTML